MKKKKIIVAKHAGFCFGVWRAVEMAREAINKEKTGVFCLGEIIHNPRVILDLKKSGLKTISDSKNVKAGETMVIRSHGVSPEIIQKALAGKIKIVDATCPFVKKAQKTAINFQKDGRQAVIFGDPKHAEVIGIKGGAKKALVVRDEKEAAKLKFFPKIGLLAQTTQKPDVFKKIIAEIFRHTNDLNVINTICLDSFNKKEEVKKIAKNVDVMVVVGGKKSNNTKKLFEVGEENGTKTYQVEKAAEVKKEWFLRAKKIGIAAGASTPDESIREVLDKIKGF